MRSNPQLRCSASEIVKLLNQEIEKTPACLGAHLGPIIQRDIPGGWTVHLHGNPSGSCQRAFIAVRSRLQEILSITPFEKG